MSREELRGRAGAPDEKVFAYLLGALQAEGLLVVERDKVRLASHEIRLSAEQQRALTQVEEDFLKAGAAPPSAEEALGRAGLRGGEEHELFQALARRAPARPRQGVALLPRGGPRRDPGEARGPSRRSARRSDPADIKDLLGISRKYAIPLLEYFDGRRVTARVGERRVLRGA